MIAAIGHIHAEAGTATLDIGSAGWGRQQRFQGQCGGRFCLWSELIDSIFAVFDITPPPSRRIITSGLIVAIGHIHAEAGTTALGIGSAVWGLLLPLFLCPHGGVQ